MSPMQCREFRDIADSFSNDEMLMTTDGDMPEYLKTCAECGRELGVRRNLRERLRAACLSAPDAQVRPEFVERLRVVLRAAVSQSTFRK